MKSRYPCYLYFRGMKPSVSVNYSSSTKDGLLGYGFDLTGLSIISRIPSDMFHDGRSTAVDFSCYDQFALMDSVSC